MSGCGYEGLGIPCCYQERPRRSGPPDRHVQDFTPWAEEPPDCGGLPQKRTCVIHRQVRRGDERTGVVDLMAALNASAKAARESLENKRPRG